jgi:hypothetical protein
MVIILLTDGKILAMLSLTLVFMVFGEIGQDDDVEEKGIEDFQDLNLDG